MAIVVTHKHEGGRFVVLGASYTKWKSARGSAVFGNLFPVEEEGSHRVLTVCGADGVIQYGNADEFVVLTIDGQSPEHLLGSDGTSPA